jgi:AcrR family transcriptional regulator
MPKPSSGTTPLAGRVRASSRRRRDGERTSMRQLIFAAAEVLLLEQGYEGFSLRQVAERIGYTPTTIYRYFPDRDALIFALTDEGFREFGARLAAAAGAAEPGEALAAIGRAYARFGIEHPVYYRLMFMQRPDYLAAPRCESGEARLASFDVLRNAAARVIATGKVHASVADADALSDLLWATIHGAVSLAITMPHFDRPRAEALVEHTLALVRRGLEPGGLTP